MRAVFIMQLYNAVRNSRILYFIPITNLAIISDNLTNNIDKQVRPFVMLKML